jgi:hypothetical protein
VAYSLEQRAETVAEYLLTGSVEHARRLHSASWAPASKWIASAEASRTESEKQIAERAQAIADAKRAELDAAYQRALELQYRDLPEAGFRDRTGFLKILGEQRTALGATLPPDPEGEDQA